jgi:unsaturated chondroitin disaccharide hydrolase
MKITCLLFLLCPSLSGWTQRPHKAAYEKSFTLAVQQYITLDQFVPDSLMPRSIYPDGTLRMEKSGWWTSGFFPGSLWYLYEYSKNTQIKNAALRRTHSIEKEKWNDYDHDIGFKFTCSYGNAFRLTKDSTCIPVMVTAAQTLVGRYTPHIGLIRSWGKPTDTSEYTVIIDNMMNLELLFSATRFTGDSSYFRIAVSHADKTLRNHYRPDGSSYHVVNYNYADGTIKNKKTAQGYSDASAWARGQTWGLYGFIVCYRYTGNKNYLRQAQNIARFILTHPHMPADKIPYWDFDAPDIPDAPRDASAACIAASALLELSGYVNAQDRKFYVSNAEKMLETLTSPAYRSMTGTNKNFLIQHGVGHLPAKSEVDVPLTYADYYYLEALKRWLE